MTDERFRSVFSPNMPALHRLYSYVGELITHQRKIVISVGL